MNIDPAVADCRLQGTANSPSSTAHPLYHSLHAKDKLFISNKKALQNIPKRIARTGFEPVNTSMRGWGVKPLLKRARKSL